MVRRATSAMTASVVALVVMLLFPSGNSFFSMSKDIEAATRRGIVVMNSPTGNSVTTAEHAITMMMALARHIPAADAALRAGKWDRTKFTGAEICGKTLGVVGLGNIGRIVADRAVGLKMKVIGYDPILTAEAAGRVGVELVGLDELFAQ